MEGQGVGNRLTYLRFRVGGLNNYVTKGITGVVMWK